MSLTEVPLLFVLLGLTAYAVLGGADFGAGVWQLLSAVKTEFGNFSGLLDKAQKNIQTGLNQLEDVVGARTRAIQKRLKGVDTLSNEDALKILPELTNEELNEEE